MLFMYLPAPLELHARGAARTVGEGEPELAELEVLISSMFTTIIIITIIA